MDRLHSPPVIRLFAGFDPREEVGFHTFASSVIHTSSKPVSITPLHLLMPSGSNAFTFSRFLVPYLCGFKGWAIFADGSDMVMKGDLAELLALQDPSKAVMVVKRPNYKTKHPIKYLGTDMQCPNRDYDRKNWASLMLINCEHEAWAGMVPGVVENMAERPMSLLQLSWIKDEDIGALDAHWNWLVDEAGENPGAMVLHWTAGIPAFSLYKNAPMAEEWRAANQRVSYSA